MQNQVRLGRDRIARGEQDEPLPSRLCYRPRRDVGQTALSADPISEMQAELAARNNRHGLCSLLGQAGCYRLLKPCSNGVVAPCCPYRAVDILYICLLLLFFKHDYFYIYIVFIYIYICYACCI